MLLIVVFEFYVRIFELLRTYFRKAHRNSILNPNLFIRMSNKTHSIWYKKQNKNCPESEKIYESKDKWKQIYDNVATAVENNTKNIICVIGFSHKSTDIKLVYLNLTHW